MHTTVSLGGLTSDAFARPQKTYAAWSKELFESSENSCLDIGGTLDKFTKTAEGSSLLFTEQSSTIRCRFK